MACDCGSTCNCGGPSSCSCGQSCSCKNCGVSTERISNNTISDISE
ncbi:hypothetical protein BFJ70_g7459 [Fusarium oxysporum]|nr:hypothetical protein BFJ70_g7459 [Fusarium oxysporum]